jgi:hypothetical protein
VFYYQSLNSDGVKDPFFTSSCFVYFWISYFICWNVVIPFFVIP